MKTIKAPEWLVGRRKALRDLPKPSPEKMKRQWKAAAEALTRNLPHRKEKL